MSNATAEVRGKGPMEQIITGFVDKILVPLINSLLIPFLESGGAFVVFAVLWAAFAYALVARQGSLDEAWQAIRALPIVVQGVVWLFLLPVMIGLWVWETTWPVILRLVIVGGVAGWNLLVFLPKWLTAAR
jgi:hypothetical protein